MENDVSQEDSEIHRRNTLYFDQMVDMKRSRPKQVKKKEKEKGGSFGSQVIDFKDYLIIPDGYEYIAYSLYIMLIPYIVGGITLFFTVTGRNWEYLAKFNDEGAFIIWLIGYEVSTVLMLLYIMYLFFAYDDD